MKRAPDLSVEALRESLGRGDVTTDDLLRIIAAKDAVIAAKDAASAAKDAVSAAKDAALAATAAWVAANHMRTAAGRMVVRLFTFRNNLGYRSIGRSHVSKSASTKLAPKLNYETVTLRLPDYPPERPRLLRYTAAVLDEPLTLESEVQTVATQLLRDIAAYVGCAEHVEVEQQRSMAGAFCDLALKITLRGGEVVVPLLIEVKRGLGVGRPDLHLPQLSSYLSLSAARFDTVARPLLVLTDLYVVWFVFNPTAGFGAAMEEILAAPAANLMAQLGDGTGDLGHGQAGSAGGVTVAR